MLATGVLCQPICREKLGWHGLGCSLRYYQCYFAHVDEEVEFCGYYFNLLASTKYHLVNCKYFLKTFPEYRHDLLVNGIPNAFECFILDEEKIFCKKYDIDVVKEENQSINAL